MIVHRVPPGPMWFTKEVLSNPKYLEFRKKIRADVHPKVAEIAKYVVDGQRRVTPGGAEVVARGQRFRCDTDYIKGDTLQKETYFTDEEVKEKFRNMARPMAIASESWQKHIEKVITAAYSLEEFDDITEFTLLLAP